MEPIETQDPIKKRRRSQRSIQTEQTILQHAKAIFQARGFENATTKEIAQAAQVSEGTVFHHFPTKLHLLEGIMIDIYGGLEEDAARIVEAQPDPAVRLRALIVNHVEVTGREWESLRTVIQHGRYGGEGFGEAFIERNRSYTKWFVDVIEELKRGMHLRRTTPTPLIRDAIFGTLEHFLIGHYARRRPYDPEELVDQLLDMMLFGCGVRPG